MLNCYIFVKKSLFCSKKILRKGFKILKIGDKALFLILKIFLKRIFLFLINFIWLFRLKIKPPIGKI